MRKSKDPVAAAHPALPSGEPTVYATDAPSSGTASPQPAPAGAGSSDDSRTAAAREQRIRQAAYRRYLEREGAPGDPVADWLDAEAEIDGRQPASRDAEGAAHTRKSSTGADLGNPDREYGAYGMVVQPPNARASHSNDEKQVRGVVPTKAP